jgi:hypothetical protein
LYSDTFPLVFPDWRYENTGLTERKLVILILFNFFDFFFCDGRVDVDSVNVGVDISVVVFVNVGVFIDFVVVILKGSKNYLRLAVDSGLGPSNL